MEEDKSATYVYHYKYDMTKMTSEKVNGSIKLGLGTSKVNGEVGAEITNTTTKTETKEFTITRQEEDDNLGTIKIYFYDSKNNITFERLNIYYEI